MNSNERWFSIKNTLSSASRKPKVALCTDNRKIWRFILEYSITVHHKRLVLEQWTKRWMAVHLLNYKVKYYVCKIKAFDKSTEYYLNFYTENIAT